MRVASFAWTREIIIGAEYMGMMRETSFDHEVTRVVAVDAENLRARLVDALERMDYRGLWRLGRTIKHRPELEELPILSRRSFVEGANPPAAAALSPQSIQHPAQHLSPRPPRGCCRRKSNGRMS